MSAWLPALDGVVDKLQAGASVADVGCGLGASTIIMAQAFGRSTFLGVDNHEASITEARKAAAEAGVGQRTRFETASARELPGTGYDLVCMFDCLHDMGDPVGAARHARQALAPDGTLLLVEPMAGDGLEENLNPVGRTFYGLCTVICTPGSLDQEVGPAARGGFQQRAPGDSDPVQPHPGGQAMTVAPIAASSACPRARSAPPMATSVRAH